MKKNLFILFCLLNLSTYAQVVEERSNFDKVTPGISEFTLRELVGPPARIEPFYSVSTINKDTTSYWVYNNLYTIAIKNHTVDYVAKDRVQFLNKIEQWTNQNNKDGIRIKYYNR
jgi:hypothetical protein